MPRGGGDSPVRAGARSRAHRVLSRRPRHGPVGAVSRARFPGLSTSQLRIGRDEGGERRERVGRESGRRRAGDGLAERGAGAGRHSTCPPGRRRFRRPGTARRDGCRGACRRRPGTRGSPRSAGACGRACPRGRRARGRRFRAGRTCLTRTVSNPSTTCLRARGIRRRPPVGGAAPVRRLGRHRVVVVVAGGDDEGLADPDHHAAAAAVHRRTDPGGQRGLTTVFAGAEATGMRRWPGLRVCRRR